MTLPTSAPPPLADARACERLRVNRGPTTTVLAMSKIASPVVGTVWKIQVAVGDSVAAGDDLMILESMKMEIPVEAESSGVVATLDVAEGDSVAEGQLLATIT